MNYRQCTHCVMDTSDPEITFDNEGVCNHCREFKQVKSKNWHPNEEGKKILEGLISQMREHGTNRKFDCIIGLSGGVDSSYLALKAVELGLRPLAVHVDGGWNTELANTNIRNICNTLNIELITEVINWDEMKDLQVAFLRAGVPNQDIPQDHAFFAALYKYAVENDIKYVLSGSNYATEGILPRSWGYNAMDAKHLLAIHKRFGSRKLKEYPTVSFFDYYINFPIIKKMKVIKPLNYMPYSKDLAIKELENEVGWQYYGGKHYESLFTKFFQAYYLPTRFGFDKRRAHLSSLIVSGQLTREEAMVELDKELYAADQLDRDKAAVLQKLGLSVDQFDELMNMPLKSHYDYPTNIRLYKFARKIYYMTK